MKVAIVHSNSAISLIVFPVSCKGCHTFLRIVVPRGQAKKGVWSKPQWIEPKNALDAVAPLDFDL